MDGRKNVLILCTKNSARSQMAEGLLRELAAEDFNVYSAGLEPDRVHPMAIEVMQEIGIDISDQRSKDVKEYLGRLFADYLVIVCANAEQRCPSIFPGMVERLFWPFDDPAAVIDSEQAQREAFRRVRDEICEFVRGLPDGLAYVHMARASSSLRIRGLLWRRAALTGPTLSPGSEP